MTHEVWANLEVAAIAELLHDRTGLVFPANRQGVAEAGMRRAMKRVGISDFDQYQKVVRAGGAALDDLVAELTIGETYFFREPKQLEFVRNTVLPKITRLKAPSRDQPLRVWSAGCASGEEPYTLAIILKEEGLADRSRVIGTEISRPRLATARAGTYGKWSLRGVPEDVVKKYFVLRDRKYVLDAAIRRAVEFRYLNLAEDVYPAGSTAIWGMDLILCRNVLIYFDMETIQKVAERLIDSLSENGWLILGASDPLIQHMVPCETVLTGAGAAYRRPSRRSGKVTHVAHIDVDWLPVSGAAARGRTETSKVSPPEPRAPRTPELVSAIDEGTTQSAALIAASYAAHDYERTIELARAELSVLDASVWALLIRALANTGRLDEAQAACLTSLDTYGTSVELIYLHSLLLNEAGHPADAVIVAKRALYLDRTMIVAYLALGGALTRLERSDDARRAFENALELLAEMPPETTVPYSDGETAFRLAEIARAQSDFLVGTAA
ncbi:MAG: CheR family methyltransferase [Gemmatimonadaceae bacterium]